MEKPTDRVVVTPEPLRDGTIARWCVRIWFPCEGWGIVHSTHGTQTDAEAESEAVRARLTERRPT
jgi:hypothetical protein